MNEKFIFVLSHTTFMIDKTVMKCFMKGYDAQKRLELNFSSAIVIFVFGFKVKWDL